MADNDGIVQTIVLAGDREVIEGLNRIGEAGAKAFESLSEAVEHGLSSLGGLALLASGAAAAFAGLAVGAFKFAEAMSEAAEKTSDLSHATGESVESITGMQAAFAAGGVSAGELGQSFRRLSIVIQQSWSEIKKSSAEAGDNARRNVLNIEQAQLSLANSQRSLSQIEVDQNNARVASNFSLLNAELKLREVRSQQARERGIDTTAQDASIHQAQNRIALEEAEQAVIEANIKKQREAEEQRAAADAARIKVETDALNLNQLRRKANEDEKNDINRVIKAVQDLGTGNKDALQGINASAENLAKGIIGAAAESGHALGELKGDITDLASGGPGVKATFLEIGRILGNIEDPALRSATAARLLGRTVSQELLKVLSDPKKIEEFTQHIKELGLSLSGDDLHAFEHFREALFGLQNDISLIAQKIGATLAPAFTQTLQIINNALINNKAGLEEFAKTISGAVLGAIQSLVRVMAGNPLPGDEWVSDAVSGLKSFGSFLVQVGGIVKTVVGFIVDSFQSVAKSINETFGTNLTGTEIAIGAWAAGIAASIAGGLIPVIALAGGIATRIALAIGTALTAAAPSVAAGVAAVVTALGPLAVVLTGVVASIKLIEAVKDLMSDKEKGNAIKEGFGKRIEALSDMVKATNFSELTAAFDKFNQATEQQVAKEAAIDQERLQNKKALGEGLREAEVGPSSQLRTTETLIADAKKEADAVVAHTDRQIDKYKELGAAKREAAKSPVAASTAATDAVPAAALPAGAFRLPNGDIKLKDGSVIDANTGVRTFNGQSGGGVSPSVASGLFNELARRGLSSSDLGNIGLGSPGTATPILGSRPGQLIRVPEDAERVRQRELDQELQRERLRNNFPELPPETLTPLPQSRPSDLGQQQQFDFNKIIDQFIQKQQLQPKPQPETPRQEQPFQGDQLQKLNDALSALTEGSEGAAEQADRFAEAVDKMTQAALAFASSAGKTSDTSGGTVTAAGGGQIRGPGGPTGDKIPALLSDREFVHQAASTDFWGVDLHRAMNALDIGGVMGLLGRRFRDGGLVMQMPRHFRDGGAVLRSTAPLGGASIPVDLRTDYGSVTVHASPAAATQLQRLAATRRITSTTKRKSEFVT